MAPVPVGLEVIRTKVDLADFGHDLAPRPLSAASAVASGDLAGAVYTPSIRTYGAVKATSSARAGSIPSGCVVRPSAC
jgi:hypothetical protein